MSELPSLLKSGYLIYASPSLSIVSINVDCEAEVAVSRSKLLFIAWELIRKEILLFTTVVSNDWACAWIKHVTKSKNIVIIDLFIKLTLT